MSQWKFGVLYRAYIEYGNDDLEPLNKALDLYLPGYSLLPYESNEARPGYILEYGTTNPTRDEVMFLSALQEVSALADQQCFMPVRLYGDMVCTCSTDFQAERG